MINNDSFILRGTSPKAAELRAQVERTAWSSAPVLITGETGAGKPLVARAIHDASSRAQGPFVVCDLGAIAPADLDREILLKKREAHGGTLFLDEVGDLLAGAEPALLRIVPRHLGLVGAEGSDALDVRIIAATSRDVVADTNASRMRPDVVERLGATQVEVPSLRDRREDIQCVAEHVVREFARAQTRSAPAVSAEAMDLLCQYDWPGNLRELTNVLQRGMSVEPRAETLGWELLRVGPPPPKSGAHRLQAEWKTFKEAKDELLEEWESDYLRQVLDRSGGNMTLAARQAGIARGHLYRLLKKHALCRLTSATS